MCACGGGGKGGKSLILKARAYVSNLFYWLVIQEAKDSLFYHLKSQFVLSFEQQKKPGGWGLNRCI